MQNWLFSLLRPFHALRGNNRTSRRAVKPLRRSCRPWLEMLEDRTVPSTMSSITGSFNGAAIPAGDSVWFNSAFKASGLGSVSAVTLHVTNQTITFSASGTNYTVNVPDSTINLSSGTSVATTAFDPVSNSWITNLATNFKGNAFLGGGTFVAANGLPGGIKSVTWNGSFSTDTAGLSLSWQWGGAVYSSFNGDYNALNVKPLDGKGTLYNNGDHAGTPEAYKSFVVAGATGPGGGNGTGSLSPAMKLTPSVDGVATLYPFASSNPLTSVAFSESDVLTASKLDLANGTFEVWYTDEHALSLGVRQVNVITSSGTTTTNYPITPLTTDPGVALNPLLGTTAASGDQAGTDLSGRPIAPSLYITDITNNPNNLSGDWQYGGTAIAPGALFGAWKGAVRTVDDTTSPATVTVTCDADPSIKNGWNLGAGADAPPAGASNDGYGAEVRWNLNDLYKQGLLIPGHTYRFYIMVHDGDQNKSGGDAGQAAFNYNYAGPPPSTLAGFVSNNSSGTPTALANVLVTLTGTTISGQGVLLTATSAADGSYGFSNLPPGTYTLADTPPANYVDSATTAGTVAGSTDGTVPQFGTIAQIALAPGSTGINYDFVEVKHVAAGPVSISGQVVDQSSGVPVGVSGITILLTGTDFNGNAVSMSTVTDSNGIFSFTNVPAGSNYTLQDKVFLPYIPAGAAAGTDNGLTDGIAANINLIDKIALNGGDSAVNYIFSVKNVQGG